MISPSSRGLWWLGTLLVFLCTMDGADPRIWPACAAAVVLLAAVAAFDAWQTFRFMQSCHLEAPASLKWFHHRESKLGLVLRAGKGRSHALECALELPTAITPAARSKTLIANVPFEIACQPQQRGQFHVQRCFLRSASRIGFWNVRIEKPLSIDIHVYPNLEHEPGAKLLFLRKPLTQHPQRQIGRGREFERLREYTQGDSFDEIDWKATARRNKPIVKVFQVERTQDVYVILDCSRLVLRDDAADQFVNAALMIALAAENHGDRFGLLTFSSRVDHFVPAARGRNHFSECRETLYRLQPQLVSPDFDELFSFLQLRVRKRSLYLFLTDLSDELMAESFLRGARMLTRNHLVVVGQLGLAERKPLFTGSVPETVDEVYTKLAGHLRWASLQEVESALRKHGVHTLALRSGQAGADLVNQYVELKQRQLL